MSHSTDTRRLKSIDNSARLKIMAPVTGRIGCLPESCDEFCVEIVHPENAGLDARY